jgi:hypothetical protein
VLVPLPGMLLLAAWGLVTWLLRIQGDSGWVQLVAFILSVLIAGAWLRIRPSITRAEQRIGVLMLLVIAISCGKALYSPGPPGELFHGAISRTNEVGGRSDSRSQFYIVQLVANGLSIYSPESFNLFSPWAPTFRGPIAGMAAAPLVLLTGASVPKTAADQQWAPFDSLGFTVYRLFMICLAACTLPVFYGTAEALGAAPPLALLATALLGSSPFWVHEVYFTWPKLFCTSLVLMSAFLAFRGRCLLAGVMLGFAYLVHPLAPFSAPVIVLAIAAELIGDRKSDSCTRQLFVAVLWRSAAVAAILAAVVFIWATHFATGRSPFPQYVFLANFAPAGSFGNWLLDRAYSVLNTLVPFHLIAFFRPDANINAVGSVSPLLVQFFFSYWNTLPFAMGLGIFFPWSIWVTRSAKRFAAPFLVAIALPFVFFAIYWGASHSGLMREGLHPWYCTLFLFLTWAASRTEGMSRTIAKTLMTVQPVRTIELLAMLLATTVLPDLHLVNPKYAVTDVAALMAMVGGSLLLARSTCLTAAELVTTAPEPESTKSQHPKSRRAKR